MEESRRVPSPMRAADVRDVSSTSSTRRSRSGRHVRTMTSDARAVARQSIERTSSPMTYSRNESNSVPCPRIMSAVRPSSSRSRARREGRCLRDGNPGSTRTPHGAAREAWRPARRMGPIERTVTRSGRRSPRRAGRSTDETRATRPGATSTRVAGDLDASGRGPGVAQDPVDLTRPGVARGQGHHRLLPEARGRVAAAGQGEVVRRPGEAGVHEQERDEGEVDEQHCEQRAGDQRHRRGQQHGDERGATGDDHAGPQRGVGTVARMPSRTASAVTPSSSASGRSDTRCRSAGRARALTSSGET